MDLFRKSNKYTFLGYIIISSLATASCLSSLFGDFVFDDTEVILNNDDILPSTPLSNIFLHDYWGSSIRHNLSHKSYRPLTILTFRINYILSGGLKSWSFHLVNIILHVVISNLSWSVFSKILGKGRNDTAFFGAVLFSVHPIHSEAICGIVGRADLLAALFFFLSFLTFTKAVARETNGWPWTLLSVVLATVSMFCKEQGITVIGILIIYDILFTLKVDFYKLVTSWSYISLKVKTVPNIFTFIIRQFILISSAGALILFRYYLMDFQSPPFQVLDNPASFEKDWLTRVLSYNYIFCLNIWLLLCPDWLCFDWSMGCIPIVNIIDKRIFFVLLFWVLFGFIIWKGLTTKNFRKQRDILMSVSLIVIPFLPASNLFFRVGFVLAERVLYIPSAGLCLLVVCGIEVLTKHFPLNKSFLS
ncbi:UNVERIFIED_CONTAM: hypothetical protein PYX00_002225 [Menopon gallinae]|uniref:DUF1736 domain-containing protein n=1 Tax=Menopon gallinae TaxID=328185 RepID=A0AAW2IH86_9NEOP